MKLNLGSKTDEKHPHFPGRCLLCLSSVRLEIYFKAPVKLRNQHVDERKSWPGGWVSVLKAIMTALVSFNAAITECLQFKGEIFI